MVSVVCCVITRFVGALGLFVLLGEPLAPEAFGEELLVPVLVWFKEPLLGLLAWLHAETNVRPVASSDSRSCLWSNFIDSVPFSD
jgi:hypothetical protein